MVSPAKQAALQELVKLREELETATDPTTQVKLREEELRLFRIISTYSFI